MRRIIGRFKPGKAGGWEGEIRSLGIKEKVRIVPNDDRVHPDAPAFRMLLGWSSVGEGWEARSHGDRPRDFLRFEIDGPLFPMTIYAALFADADDGSALMVWDRQRQVRRSPGRSGPETRPQNRGSRHDSD